MLLLNIDLIYESNVSHFDEAIKITIKEADGKITFVEA